MLLALILVVANPHDATDACMPNVGTMNVKVNVQTEDGKQSTYW